MTLFAGHRQTMLTEIYIEALLVDEGLGDEVWEAWDKGEIDDETAILAWWSILGYENGSSPSNTRCRKIVDTIESSRIALASY